MGSLSVSKAREGVGRRGYIRSRQTGNVRDKDKLIAMPASSSAYKCLYSGVRNGRDRTKAGDQMGTRVI